MFFIALAGMVVITTMLCLLVDDMTTREERGKVTTAHDRIVDILLLVGFCSADAAIADYMSKLFH
jgi:hypothetical protein